MTSAHFSGLTLTQRLQLLRDDGEFIASRTIPSYHVSLFAIYGFYAEMYVVRSLNQVQWIEIQTNKQILLEYTKDLDLGEMF